MLYEAQALGAAWPAEWGGVGEASPLKELILSEEVARAGLPPLADQTHLAAYALLRFGTEEQKQAFLPPIRRGEHVWCQLFSEPNAGSDLAGLQTRARLDGERYIVDGQKVWSSNAQWAEYGFLLARTDQAAERHHGITAFALDMSLPGIEVRPLREITGTADFNEVFFTGVAVPAGARLGAEGDGWRVAMESLGAERAGIGAGAVRLRQLLDALVLTARAIGDQELPGCDDGARPDQESVGRLMAKVEICNLLVHARIEREMLGLPAPADLPVGKLVYSELNLELIEYALRLLGSRSVLTEGDQDAVDDGRWQDEFLYARTYTIAGGSSEIMRNILAERVLGMPREARPAQA